MIKMKKILIIDDKSLASGSAQNLSILVDELKRAKAEFSQLIDITRIVSDFFEFDKAGNYCQPKFQSSEYDYIFIHHSQQDDKMLPSNAIDLIKQNLGSKVILFSGSIDENFEDNNAARMYRSIKRETLWNRLSKFVKLSFLLQRWEIQILFYDYEKVLINKVMSFQDKGLNTEKIFSTNEMKDFLKVKRISADSAIFASLINLKGFDLIDKLRSI